jgi:hypothetical protein
MDISSTGQVGSLTPEASRPNAPARPQPDQQSAPPTGGAPEAAPSQVVTDARADAGASNGDSRDAPQPVSGGIDILV